MSPVSQIIDGYVMTKIERQELFVWMLQKYEVLSRQVKLITKLMCSNTSMSCRVERGGIEIFQTLSGD